MIYCRCSCVLCSLPVRLCKPTAECRAGFDRIRRENDGGPCGSSQLLIYGIVYLKYNSKDILLIICIYRKIFGNHGSDSELIGRSRIDPFADLVLLRSDLRQIVDRKTGINISGSGLFCPIFLNEGYGIGDLLTLIHHCSKWLCHNRFRCNLSICIILLDPLRIIPWYFRYIRKLISDGFA